MAATSLIDHAIEVLRGNDAGVFTKPGQMAFAVMPSLPYSHAVTFVKPTSPAFAAAYAPIILQTILTPAVEATLMILPHRFFTIWGSTVLVHK